MSVIIKSNNVASNSLGTVKMLGTTAQAEFDKYKARVVADGGVVKDEGRTKRAFMLLFATRMYGNINSFVSGSFGSKINSTGGITKLYAIDGADLIGRVYGTGTLPTLTPENNISFASNSVTDDVNGGMFSSEQRLIMSKQGSFGMGARMFSSGAGTTAYAPVAGLSKHDITPNTSVIADLDISKVNSSYVYTLAKEPLNLTAGQKSEPLAVSYHPLVAPFIVCLSQQFTPYKIGFRSGVEMGTKSTDKTFEAIKTEDFYLDFGGVYHSNGKKFAIATIIDFICLSQATSEQAAALSTFSV